MTLPNGFVISLMPSRLSVMLVRRGSVRQTESLPLLAGDWGDVWSEGLMSLDLPLRQLLSRFSGKKCDTATLLYDSPTLTKNISSSEQNGSFARDAARSKMRELVGFDAPVCVTPLGTDTGSDPVLMLAYSDRDETLRSLYAWLNRCGVRASGMIPASVASIVIASEQARTQDDETALFYLDTHCSVICHATGGRLSFVRPADIGYEKLAESYRQVYQEHHAQNADEQSKASFGVQESMACLFKYGIPFQQQQCDGIELRSGVLPRMAPVLQRIGIDVKQTIRFGFGGGLSLKNLVVAGPGAAIPMITRAVGEHLELHMQLAPGHEQYEPFVSGGRGTTEYEFVELSTSVPTLLPRIADEERSRKKLRSTLCAGVMLALLAMGGQYAYSLYTTRNDQAIMQSEAARFQRVVSFEESREQAGEVRSMMSDIAQLVASHTDATPNWETPLAQLGKLVGGSVRIQELRGELDNDEPALLISGFSIAEGELTPGQVLDRFVKQLSELDEITSVKLGITSRIDLSDPMNPDSEQWGSQFSLKAYVQSRESPYDTYAEATSTQSEWKTP